MDRKSSNNSECSDNNSELGRIEHFTIGKLALNTNIIGQIASLASLNGKCEPLPFTDYSEFDEKYDKKELNININLFLNNKHIFVPGQPIKVKVMAKRRSRYHFINQLNYIIELNHYNYKWKINREYKDIKEIHEILSKIVKKDIGKSCSDFENDEIKPDWPIFPSERDNSVLEDKIEERCKVISEYLERLLTYPPFRDHPAVVTLFENFLKDILFLQFSLLKLNFLNVSPLSFIKDVSHSTLEGYLHKHTYENIYFGHFSQLKKCCFKNFNLLNRKRWFSIKDTYITNLNPTKNNSLGFTMLVDRKFLCKKTMKAGAYYAIEIKNLQRSMILKFKNSEQQNEWYYRIMFMVEDTGKYFNYEEFLPNGSFAPVRKNQFCHWYINAALYMEDVMNAINNAKEEIFITDWWLCPELYLKRPTYNSNHRLDKLLLKKSKQNVKIYILIYKEIDILLGLSSERVRSVLTQNGKNKNIRVICHPKNNAPNFTMWSHHEKFVIIDQSIAFLGGIDLCFGRWDDDEHRLVDLDKNITEIDLKKYPFTLGCLNQEKEQTTELIDFDNALRTIVNTTALTCNLASNVTSNTKEDVEEAILTFNRMTLSENEEIDFEKSKTKRIKRKLKRIKKTLKEKKLEFEKIDSDFSSNTNSENESKTNENEFTDNESLVDVPDSSIEIRYWLGKDYSNSYIEDFKDIHDFAKDQFDRTQVQRMPWRDEAMVIVGESARDLARHFIQRWNHAKHELEFYNDEYPYLLPKSYTEPVKYNLKEIFSKNLYKCSVQILRSLDTWSGGLTDTECSILNTYCDLISKAEHYIYIENQFFVTTTNSKKDNIVKNQIGQFLVERISRAYNEKKNFRVYVVIPLLPGFQNMNTILAVQYYNLRSIKFGDFSIYSELEKRGIKDPSEYITFHGMRNWSVLMGKLVQEIVYVHSKLMIVDDKYVVCGSANINDRSMLGKRDSEVAGLIIDEEFSDSVLDKKNVMVGKYAFSLRVKIFKLHLGIYFKNPNRIDVVDCVCDEFYQNFRKVSQKNTKIYDEIFKCLPSDNISNHDEIKFYSKGTCLNKTDPIKAKTILQSDIMGFIVDFPLKFLSNEKNFFPSMMTAEGIVPTSTWT